MAAKSSIFTDEESLIKACIRGDERAFKQVFETWYGRMLNVCIRYAANTDEAKDILQEGFIRAFKNINQYAFKGSFEGWLRKVMVHTAINQYRKNQLRLMEPINDSNERMIVARESDYYNSILADLGAKEILMMVQQLSPAYRAIFNLSVMDDCSHKEIADLLGITESTSRSNLLKARISLQKMIQENNKEKLQHHG